MKKIIVFVFVITIIISGLVFKNYLENKTNEKKIDDIEFDNVVEKVEESNLLEKSEVLDTKEITEQTKENVVEIVEVKEEKVEEKKQTTNNSKCKTSNINNSNVTSTKQQNEHISKVPEEKIQIQNITTPEEQKTESKPEERTKETTQKNTISTTFYDSITHGRKEFKSEAEAIARGDKIVDNELNYVLDWNENHPENQIQPTINYYRIYPSAIDENGEYWYYLHFFTTKGEGQDDILKSKY